MKNEKHFLETVKWGVIPICNYRNCLVERSGDGGYRIFGKIVFSDKDVDSVIDGAEKFLENSISKTRNDE